MLMASSSQGRIPSFRSDKMQSSIIRIPSSMHKLNIINNKLCYLPYGHKHQHYPSKRITLRTHRNICPKNGLSK